MNRLANKIIISTRPLSENDSIKNHLTEKGAIVFDFPMIEICAADFNDNIKNTFQNILAYQWIVFTSKNGVEYFFKLLNHFNISQEKLSSIKIAVIGKKTFEEVLKNNCMPFLVSSGNTSEDLLNELVLKIQPNENILLPFGELAEDTLEKELSKIANVTRMNVYKTIKPETTSKDIIESIRDENYDIILFTSPSGFQNFKITMEENGIYSNFRTACIGKTTEKEMLKHNCTPLFVSSRSDGESFAQELETFLITHKI